MAGYNSLYADAVVQQANNTTNAAATPFAAHAFQESMTSAALIAIPGVSGDHHHSCSYTPCRPMSTCSSPQAMRSLAAVAPGCERRRGNPRAITQTPEATRSGSVWRARLYATAVASHPRTVNGESARDVLCLRKSGTIQSHGAFVASAMYTYNAAKSAHDMQPNARIHRHSRRGRVTRKWTRKTGTMMNAGQSLRPASVNTTTSGTNARNPGCS